MNLNLNNLLRKIAILSILLGIVIFMFGFTLNHFTFDGFNSEHQAWYQLMVFRW